MGISNFPKAKKKKICFVTTLYITLNTFVKPQAEFLINNGYEVTWVCSDGNQNYNDIPNGIRLITIPFKRGVDFFGVPRAIYKLFRLFRNEDFDIVQYSTPNAAFYTSTAARFSRVPVRLYAQWGIRYVGFTGLTRNLLKYIERWCCFCSSVIEPDSFSNLEFSINERLYPPSKGRVIWNGSACGVNLKRFDYQKKEKWRAQYREKLGLKPHHLVIGFVGSLRRDKGCNELFAACRTLFFDFPCARLLIIGDKNFYHTIKKELRDWVRNSRQVIYIPSNNQIPQYLSCMDIFSFSSYREGFGLVVVEAGAMGVPVIASNVPGPIDAIRHEETGLIVPVKDIDALRAGLKILLSDQIKRDKFGKAANDYVCKNFDQNEFLRQVLEDKEGMVL